MAILVNDVCGKYQGLVDFHKMATQVQGVIIQMCYGTLLTPLAKELQANSKGVIPRWFYQYFYPEYSPVQQASAFVSSMNGDYGLGLWVDVEEPSVAWSQFQCDQLHLMLTEVERLSGIRPGIYSGEWFADPYLKLATFLSDYPVWLANYPTNWNPNMPPAPVIPQLWKGKPWTLWQWTDNGDAAANGCAGRSESTRLNSSHITLSRMPSSA